MAGNAIKEKMKVFVKATTVEPVFFLYNILFGLNVITTLALYYRKACMILYDDDWICDNLNQNETFENEVQTVNSQWNFYNLFASSIPSMVLTLFVYSTISDKVSRKLPILIGLAGNFIVYPLRLYAGADMQSTPYILLLASFIQGICGGTSAIFMGTISYVAAITSNETRTFRISLLYGCSYVGFFISFSFSGILLEQTGFTFMYSLCMILNGIAFLYLIFLVPDVKAENTQENLTKSNKSDKAENKNVANAKNTEENDGVDNSHINKAFTVTDSELRKTQTKENLYSIDERNDFDENKDEGFCTLDKIKDPILVAFRKRPNNNRAHVLAVLGAFSLYFFNALDNQITYLYLRKEPLSFSTAQYGYYNAFKSLLQIGATFILIPILVKKLRLATSLLFSVALLSQAVDYFIMGVSVEQWMVYIAPVIGILQAGTYTFGRSQLSSMVNIDEIGKIFGIVGILQDLLGVASSAFYSFFLYPQTLDFFAGFSYILAATLLLVPVALAVWVHVDVKRSLGIKNTGLSKGYNENKEEHRISSISITMTDQGVQ